MPSWHPAAPYESSPQAKCSLLNSHHSTRDSDETHWKLLPLQTHPSFLTPFVVICSNLICKVQPWTTQDSCSRLQHRILFISLSWYQIPFCGFIPHHHYHISRWGLTPAKPSGGMCESPPADSPVSPCSPVVFDRGPQHRPRQAVAIALTYIRLPRWPPALFDRVFPVQTVAL
jgi:hypothetical protein